MTTMSMATMNLAVNKGSVRASRAAAGVPPSAAVGPAARAISGQPRRALKLAARARGFQAGGAHAQAALRESAMQTGASRADRLVVNAADAGDTDRVENVVIIGSGPAGYTSAIYAGRANLKPLCFEGMSRGGVPGGQLMSTTEVENFPGFPAGITGPDLMDRMRQQAERWGAELYSEDVEYVDTSVRPFVIRSTDREVRAHSIVIATGATAKRLGLPSEHDFWSRGISACAICDGASPLFKGKPVGVVGGGDSALEEAVYLTKYAQHVHLFVRADKMRASKAMQDRVLANEMITVHFNSTPVDVYPDLKGRMAGLEVKATDGEETRKVEMRGLFYGIGHNPNSDIFEGQLDMDEAGYLKVTGANKTSVEGVFSAGDVHDTEWRQAITAAGSGCSAAISVERYLTLNGLLSEFHQAPENLVQVEGAKVKVEASNPNTAETPKVETKQDFDISKQYHAGQFALRKLYHESPRLLGVLYTSPTCGPCRRLKPMLAKVLGEYEDSVHFVEIDIVEDPEIAEAAGVMGTPRVDFFFKKDRVEVMNGVKMKSDYRKVFDQYVDKVKAEV